MLFIWADVKKKDTATEQKADAPTVRGIRVGDMNIALQGNLREGESSSISAVTDVSQCYFNYKSKVTSATISVTQDFS